MISAYQHCAKTSSQKPSFVHLMNTYIVYLPCMLVKMYAHTCNKHKLQNCLLHSGRLSNYSLFASCPVDAGELCSSGSDLCAASEDRLNFLGRLVDAQGMWFEGGVKPSPNFAVKSPIPHHKDALGYLLDTEHFSSTITHTIVLIARKKYHSSCKSITDSVPRAGRVSCFTNAAQSFN